MDGLFEPGLGFGFGGLFWDFGRDGTLGFVCFLTIEDGRKRNVGGIVLLNPRPARGVWFEQRLWRTRFERIISTKAFRCLGVNVLVNSCVTRLPWPLEAAVSKPNQSLIKLESLILAQNERWRQA